MVSGLLMDMNSWMNLIFFIFLVPLLIMAALAWFASDMRSILKSGQRKNQLSIEGKWRELEQHFERISKTYRPFVWLHQQYLLPGTVPAQHALFLFKQGRLDEALAKVDRAIRQIEGKPRLFRSIHRSETFRILCSSLRARTLILTGLGRYGDAREVAARLQQLTGPGDPNAALALLEFYCGHLDEALAMAQPVPPGDKQYDSMRAVTALAYGVKGEFDQAIQALLYEPSDISKFYSPAGLQAVSESPEGPKLIELQRRKHGGVFEPARLILLAQVYVAKGEFENADRALDQAEKSIGPEPGIQTSYCRHRTCSLAAQGKATEAENYIKRMRAIVQQLPKRSLLWETHFAAGQSYLYLGRFNDALTELIEAQRSVLHPIEKHATAYWIARVHEAAGNHNEAIPYYQIVVADTIQSWMRKQAVETLTRFKS
jgi:tetratricopeptide (TPR) repeat protein